MQVDSENPAEHFFGDSAKTRAPIGIKMANKAYIIPLFRISFSQQLVSSVGFTAGGTSIGCCGEG
jgi:hypothetical protein